MFNLKASCPTRIDIAGGTVDLWPLYHQLPQKATVNLAIDLRARVSLIERSRGSYFFKSLDQDTSEEGTFKELIRSTSLPLHGLFLEALWDDSFPGLTIESKADSPKGAGLGGSSSLAIALSASLMKARELIGASFTSDEEKLVACAMNVESLVIKSPSGCQDNWAAMRGGLNLLSYPYGGVKVETLSCDVFSKAGLEMLPVYSGQSRDSSLNNWSVYKNFFSGESKTIKAMEEIGRLAFECAVALRQGRPEEALALSEKEWFVRQDLLPDIETPATQKVDSIAKAHGAIFSRVCGAGGGGVVCCFVPKEKKEGLEKALEKEDLKVLKAPLTREGLSFS